MIIKLLGILDIAAAVLFWLFAFFHIIPASFITLASLYLLAKGIGFLISEHFASVGDIIAGLIMFASINFVMPSVVVIIVTLYILQKGIFSLL